MTSVRGGRAIDTQSQVIILSLTIDMVMFVSHLETLSRLDGNDSGTGGNMPAVLSPYVWVRAWLPQRTDIVSCGLDRLRATHSPWQLSHL